MLDLWNYLLVFGAAMVAGLFNALSGGGTLFLFPVLLNVGLIPVVAAATSAATLLTGYAYRDLLKHWDRQIFVLLLVAVLGSIFGAYGLTIVSEEVFKNLIPILLLLATLLFILSDKLVKFGALGVKQSLSLLLLLFLTSVYGGFFGAGMGIMLMVTLQFFYKNISDSWL